jgi:acetyl-CoA synthetase
MKWGTTSRQVRPVVDAPARAVGEPINPEAWLWYRKYIGGDRLPDRRHLVADRDRRDHDQPAARASRPRARVGAEADPRHLRRDPRRRGQPLHRSREGRLPGAHQAVAVDAARHLGRPGALPRHLLEPLRPKYYFAGDGAKYDERRQHLAARPGRRRHERLRSPPLDRRDRVGPGLHPKVAEAAVVGATDETTGQAVGRLRHPARGRRHAARTRTSCPRSCAATSARRSADRQAAQRHDRLGAAQDPLGQDHAPPAARTSPRAARSAT